jgi:hypothetical protein
MPRNKKPASIFMPADLSYEFLIDYEQIICVNAPVQRRKMMVIP